CQHSRIPAIAFTKPRQSTVHVDFCSDVDVHRPLHRRIGEQPLTARGGVVRPSSVVVASTLRPDETSNGPHTIIGSPLSLYQKWVSHSTWAVGYVPVKTTP